MSNLKTQLHNLESAYAKGQNIRARIAPGINPKLNLEQDVRATEICRLRRLIAAGHITDPYFPFKSQEDRLQRKIDILEAQMTYALERGRRLEYNRIEERLTLVVDQLSELQRSIE